MPDIAAPPPAAETWLPSPCIGICQIDRATGWCGGCGRSEKELAGWRDMPAFAQRAVWADLPRRNAILGLRFRLLPLAGPLLLDRLAEWSAVPGAAWSIGVHGAAATLAANDEKVTVAIQDSALRLATRGGRAIIRLVTGARAFELVDGRGNIDRIVLALHRARLRQLPPAGLAFLDGDPEALDPSARDGALFDLGFARRSMRFCIRTQDPELAELLKSRTGAEFLAAPDLAAALARSCPTRVLISPFGRIEVDGPFLPNDLAGPHVRLMPELLRTGREIEPGLEVPPDYVPCASFHPGGPKEEARHGP
jgi:predicted Fe-S protein YdhL (DUF1289 family)